MPARCASAAPARCRARLAADRQAARPSAAAAPDAAFHSTRQYRPGSLPPRSESGPRQYGARPRGAPPCQAPRRCPRRECGCRCLCCSGRAAREAGGESPCSRARKSRPAGGCARPSCRAAPACRAAPRRASAPSASAEAARSRRESGPALPVSELRTRQDSCFPGFHLRRRRSRSSRRASAWRDIACRTRAAGRRIWSPRRTESPTAPKRAGRACRRGPLCARQEVSLPAAEQRSSSARPACRRAARHRSLPGLDAVYEPRQAVGALDRLVVVEAQLGDGVHLDPSCELRAQEAGGALQSFAGLLEIFFVENREKHLGVRHVWRDVHRGDRYHADARVAQLAVKQVGQLALDQIADFLRTALPAFHSVRATSRTSNTSNWSPSLMSEKFFREMPHSKPAFTSRTSSLKRFSASISPVWMTTLSRSKRTWALRLTMPSST